MTRRIHVTGGGLTGLRVAAALAGLSGVVVTQGDYADERQPPRPPAVIRIAPDPCGHPHPNRGKRRRQWR